MFPPFEIKKISSLLFNIVLNLIYEPSSVCAIDFSDAYKKQMTRIKTGKDII